MEFERLGKGRPMRKLAMAETGVISSSVPFGSLDMLTDALVSNLLKPEFKSLTDI